jgi:hypothetical protein
MKDGAAWLAFSAAMIALIINIVMGYIDRREARNKTLIDQRRHALFTALEVIDHVYANERLDGKPPVHPHSWNLQKARDAMNGILVYCDKPDQTLDAYKRALGLHDPSIEKPPGIDLSYLDRFRSEVTRELNLPIQYKGNPHFTWISNLAGGEIQ